MRRPCRAEAGDTKRERVDHITFVIVILATVGAVAWLSTSVEKERASCACGVSLAPPGG